APDFETRKDVGQVQVAVDAGASIAGRLLNEFVQIEGQAGKGALGDVRDHLRAAAVAAIPRVNLPALTGDRGAAHVATDRKAVPRLIQPHHQVRALRRPVVSNGRSGCEPHVVGRVVVPTEGAGAVVGEARHDAVDGADLDRQVVIGAGGQAAVDTAVAIGSQIHGGEGGGLAA